MPRRHDELEPLPPVEMTPLRKLVHLVSVLERLESGEIMLPEAEPEMPAASAEWSGTPLSSLRIKLTNLHNAIRCIAEYRLDDWDHDPLVIRRFSELGESG